MRMAPRSTILVADNTCQRVRLSNGLEEAIYECMET